MSRIISLLFCFVSFTTFAQVQKGTASFYADKFEGMYTASGDRYKSSKLTAAHRSLSFGTKVRVTNLSNNESVVVEINDRGPFMKGRIIDVSKAAAEQLHFFNQGTTEVTLEIVDITDGKENIQPVPTDHVVEEDKEFYNFNISRITQKGLGVQLVTYQELGNVMKIVNNLKSKYKKNVVVQGKVVSGVNYYSIILTDFAKRKNAEAMANELRKKFPDAFVVDYSK